MRKTVLGLLLASTCVSITGCGGCGGLSQDDMRRRSRKRAPEEESPAVVAPPQPTSIADSAAAKPPQVVNESKPPAQAQPATEPPALPPPGPIRVVVRNPKPDKPLKPAERRDRSAANLKKIGEAIAAHVKRTGSLPATISDQKGNRLLSWRVALLPYLGYGELHRQFQFDQGWDSQHNQDLLEQIPPEYQSPERFDIRTNYLGLAGSGQAFAADSRTAAPEIKDGLDNTVLLVEVDEDSAVPWTKPTDFVPALGSPRSGTGGLRADGIFALLGQGRVVRLGPELADEQLLALFSIAGGEQISAAELLQEPSAEAAQLAAEATSEPAAVASASAAAPATVPGNSTPPNPNLLPVPSEEDLAQARALFRDLYGKQYDEARTWEDKAKLAKELLAEAAKVEKNPAHYHELLRITRDVAASAADAPTALKATALLIERFEVDGLPLRLKTLSDLAKTARKAESADPLRKEAQKLVLDAFDADQFDVALGAHERLVEFTRIQGDRAELSRIANQKQALEAARQAHRTATAAIKALEANPDDPAACETLGKYLCFVKNHWDAGLPHLARAQEVKLRIVAGIDLELKRSPQQTFSLADQYWEMAEQAKPPHSRGLHLRAAFHYQSAANLLPDGLEKLKAQKRIDEAGEIYGKTEVARALASTHAQAVSMN